MSDPDDDLRTLYAEVAGETDVLTEQPHDSLDEQYRGDNDRLADADESIDVDDGLTDAVSGAESKANDDIS